MHTILDKIRYKDKKVSNIDNRLTSRCRCRCCSTTATMTFTPTTRNKCYRPFFAVVNLPRVPRLWQNDHHFNVVSWCLLFFWVRWCWCLCQNGAHNGVSLGLVYCCGVNTGIRMTLNRTSFVIMEHHFSFTVCWVGDTTFSTMTLSRTLTILDCYSVECPHVECVASTSPFVATTFNTMTLSITALATVVYHSVVCIVLNVVAPTLLFGTEQHFILA